ncbi:phenylalanine--tRNA ligase subunit alpha [Candidatus Peregrinibacteria bacterium CG22_combo_CG10-13_8_21_14_all_49_11]|nr:MAG: phenylalanine--tRNA ligase subunit alpha [Candidatus Peregrinibacteria bacterium CG22_combo_CG10-13_8_21_14_all_49_11]
MASIHDLITSIASVTSLKELASIEQQLFGRKSGLITVALKELKDLPPKEKKEKAVAFNMQKRKAQELLEEKHTALERDYFAKHGQDTLDVTLSLPLKEYGHLHLIPEYIEEIKDVFGRMGFDVADGPEIETEETNFDLLNFPDDHPARDAQGIFYLAPTTSNTKNTKPLLRAHTSPVQIHYMKQHKPPFRMICPGKVYRKDADATHSPVFHQFEALMVDTHISLAHMKGVMEAAMRELISENLEFRWRTGYFPFVEPGLEVDVRWQGDKETKEGKWLEIVGCGMVHPNVLQNGGIDPNQWQGFAFGFGIERMLMIRHQIPDIRMFYEGDPRFLKQF